MAGQIQHTAEHIKQSGLIAIVRGDFSIRHTLDLGEVLVAAGVDVMEVTLNSTDALAAIAQLRKHLGGQMWVGAGTVRTSAQVETAVGAGAQFIVSPNFDPASVAASQTKGILHLPGVFTASEVQAAFAAGCRMVKLFPADLLGPAYLKALRAPLDDVEFVPTGGLAADNLPDYVRAGAVAVGVGSALIAGPQQSLDEIRTRAAQLRAAWERAKHG